MLGAERLLADRQRPLEERPRRCIGRERPCRYRPSRFRRYARARFRPVGGAAVAADQIERERVEPPRARPGARVVEDVSRIDRRHRLDESPPRRLGRLALPPPRRDRAHQPMQPDRLGRDRRVALVGDRLAVDEREGAQRRDRLVEPVARELRRQRLAEFLARLGEQEQRDRLGREQRRIDDQRLGGGMQLGGFVDGEGERLRDRQAAVIFGGRVFGRVEQPRGRGLEPLAIFGERDAEPLAIGRRLLMRERQAAQRLRQRLGLGALLVASRAGDEVVRADLLRPDADFDQRGDSAPRRRVRRDERARRAAGRQIGLRLAASTALS